MDLKLYFTYKEFEQNYQSDILDYGYFKDIDAFFSLLRTKYIEKYLVKDFQGYCFSPIKKEKLKTFTFILNEILHENIHLQNLLLKNDNNLLNESVICDFYINIIELFDNDKLNHNIGTNNEFIELYKDLVELLEVVKVYYGEGDIGEGDIGEDFDEKVNLIIGVKGDLDCIINEMIKIVGFIDAYNQCIINESVNKKIDKPEVIEKKYPEIFLGNDNTNYDFFIKFLELNKSDDLFNSVSFIVKKMKLDNMIIQDVSYKSILFCLRKIKFIPNDYSRFVDNSSFNSKALSGKARIKLYDSIKEKFLSSE